MRKVKTVQKDTEVVTHIVCDVCGKEVSFSDDIFEAQEFLSVTTYGGYDSIFGDGSKIEIDMCQDCLKDKLGPYLRISDEE
jgi:antitoxin CcdA